MERETGIEPATNSLEGCDSTIELLPPVAEGNRCLPEYASASALPAEQADTRSCCFIHILAVRGRTLHPVPVAGQTACATWRRGLESANEFCHGLPGKL